MTIQIIQYNTNFCVSCTALTKANTCFFYISVLAGMHIETRQGDEDIRAKRRDK